MPAVRSRGWARASTLTSRASLNNGLFAGWLLNEASGNRLDVLGRFPLTNNNAVGSVAKGAGAPGNLPANVSDFVAASSQTLSRAFLPLDPTAGVTVSCWAKIPSVSAQLLTGFWFNGDQINTGGSGLKLGPTGGTSNRIFYQLDTDVDAVVSCEQGGPVGASLDVWHHWVAWYYPNKYAQLAVDNQIGAVSPTVTTHPAFDSGLCVVGGITVAGSPAAPYQGQISSTFVWNRILSIPEARLLNNNGNALPWPF